MNAEPRDPDAMTGELVRTAADELLALVDRRLPERFWPSEPIWRSVLTAYVARIAEMVDTLALLAEPRRQPDALIVLRAIYEHVVTFLWLAIDPRPRVLEWHGHTMVHRRVVHNDARDFGADNVLSAEELAQAERATTVKALIQRAEEVDRYWPARVDGFHTHPFDGPKHLLTLRGLYVVVYRLGSRAAHGTMESVDHCVRLEGRVHYVERGGREAPNLMWSALSIPLFAMVLVVAHERLGWPDPATVRAINDALHHEPSE
jgi:hypothetical protein